MDIDLLKQAIGRKLKEARKELDLTQDDVAKGLDITAVAYGSFERGTNLIGLNYLIEVARILGKPVTFFLPGFISPDENDILAHPLTARLLSAFQRLPNDDDRLTIVEATELGARHQEEKAREG